MSLLFISDLHLDPTRPAITQAFYHFLETTGKNTEALYILGDFFEAWLGDDDDTPLYQEVIQRLKAYTDQGTPVYLMHGNRDFLIGNTFAQQSGCTLLEDPTVLDYAGQRYLLMHGDSLCTKDSDYMQFRAMVRTPQWQQNVLSTSLEERRHYAEKLRQASQSMTSLKADDIVDVTPEEVIRIMSFYDVTKLIHGHTHRPNTHNLMINHQPAQRIVLGDWSDRAWYINIDNHGTTLHSLTI
jgi:UDP-2,3-diacylglucosamine hydrolase